NGEIVKGLREKEAQNERIRQEKGLGVIGRKRLIRQPLMKPHQPKKYGRKIFVQSKFKEIRIRIINEAKAIDALCKYVYQCWKRGEYSVPWPPGTFPPPLPPRANALA
ncbi:MAG: hypothetical protein D6719_03545, partial [Candidatus Dadabacteria bacterium]